ncbi:MAG: DUF308 domain-containing protein [Planctomycetes bacterium]|nr:DUF308 domain-containing protein [Planctomycetota bacterium]
MGQRDGVRFCDACGRTMAADERLVQAGQAWVCSECASDRVAVASPAEAMVAQMNTPPRPRGQTVHVHTHQAKSVNGLGVAALVLGILAAIVCWIPLVNLVSIPLAGIGLLLAVIGFLIALTGRKSGVGMPVSGAIVCIVAILVPILMLVGVIGVAGAGAAAIEEANRKAAIEMKRQAEARARNAAANEEPTFFGVPATTGKTQPPPAVPQVDPSQQSSTQTESITESPPPGIPLAVEKPDEAIERTPAVTTEAKDPKKALAEFIEQNRKLAEVAKIKDMIRMYESNKATQGVADILAAERKKLEGLPTFTDDEIEQYKARRKELEEAARAGK